MNAIPTEDYLQRTAVTQDWYYKDKQLYAQAFSAAL